jgi:hypothetical protein
LAVAWVPEHFRAWILFGSMRVVDSGSAILETLDLGLIGPREELNCDQTEQVRAGVQGPGDRFVSVLRGPNDR